MLPTRAKKWNKGVEETRFCQWNCFKSEQDGKKCAGFLRFKHTYSFCVQIVQIARSFFLFLWITWYTIFFCLRLFSVLIHFLRIIETANRWVSERGREGWRDERTCRRGRSLQHLHVRLLARVSAVIPVGMSVSLPSCLFCSCRGRFPDYGGNVGWSWIILNSCLSEKRRMEMEAAEYHLPGRWSIGRNK